ncbi:MAG: prolipoprotein diacylglyceryl transferase [Oscillospiraceae bacterium]|nr:prolipoprotein diacylglyceryl transferase [Oscillospiraceae bacterium]
MSEVGFPGLEISLSLSRTAFRIGNLGVHWYAILIVVAIIIGMSIYKKNDGLYGIKFDDIFDLSLYALPIGIISTRIYYILFNLDRYLADPIQMFNMRSRRTSYFWRYYRRIHHMLCIL